MGWIVSLVRIGYFRGCLRVRKLDDSVRDVIIFNFGRAFVLLGVLEGVCFLDFRVVSCICSLGGDGFFGID